MDYVVVYDIADIGFREWPMLALAAVLAVAGFVLRALQSRRGRRSPTARVLWVFAALVALFGGAMPAWDLQRLQAALHEGRAEVAEGQVSSHETQQVTTANAPGSISRYTRRTWEAFNVGTVAFGFYRDRSRAGFQNAEDQTLTLRDGQRARVHYVEDVAGDFSQRRILRLELAR